jgi:hypothetical protein
MCQKHTERLAIDVRKETWTHSPEWDWFFKSVINLLTSQIMGEVTVADPLLNLSLMLRQLHK